MTTLVFLTLINLFNYLDRYILAALLPAIKRETGFSDTKLGFLATAFMIMYFLISPLFGWLGDHRARTKVMAVGVAIWSVATALSGLGVSYAALLLARLGVGVGEAGYATISPAVLSDLFPKEKRGKIFAIFFMAIPVGSALGYLLGGLLESKFGWRHAFLFAGLPGLLLAIGLFFLPDPPRGRFDTENIEKFSLARAYAVLGGNMAYVFTVLGYCAYTFVLGGIAVWVPSYMERYLFVTAAKGNILFGGITVTAGFAGTILGGSWADAWEKKSADAYLKLSALSMLLALPVYVLVLHTTNFNFFCCFLFVLEFLFFLSTSPVNAQIVNCVPVAVRATASAVAIFSIHLLGDAISPSLVGAISDRSSLQVGMSIFSFFILLSAALWFAKVVLHFSTLPWPSTALKLPRSQCHRGFHLEGAQENTLDAFRAAKQRGATMVELDVHLSKDGEVVVVHDSDIRRISGKQGLVGELSAADLKTLASVPTLREVLLDKDSPSFVNIEIKTDKARSDGLEFAVAKLIRELHAQDRVLFSSFNPLALMRLAKFIPEVPRALLVSDERGGGNTFYLRKMLLAFLAKPHMLNLEQSIYTEERAKAFKDRGVSVALWTVKSRLEAKKLLARGAVSIISDDTEILA
jgi:glycerophosphoryl diester phosphodiesterase/MFS family permease